MSRSTGTEIISSNSINKMTDKAKKYLSSSISDQSEIKFACWDTYLEIINNAIRCLENMQVLRGSEKEQEIEGMIRCGRDTASGNLLLNCRASEEVIDSLLKRCAIGPKDVTTDDAVVVAEEEKEEEKEEIEIEEEEDAGEIKLLESIQPLQPLKLQKKDSKGEQAPAL